MKASHFFVYKDNFIAKRGTRYRYIVAFMLLLIVTVHGINSAAAMKAYAQGGNGESEETQEIYYVGKVTRGVNVRIAAGADNDQLRYNGKDVSVAKDTQVIILGEVMVGDKPWYYIRFEFDGATLEGYSTSSYIEKTSVTITPTPLPAPTSTPVPTPEPTPTKALTVTPIPQINATTGDGSENSGNTDNTGSAGSFKWYYIVIAVVCIVAAVIVYSFIKMSRARKLEISEKLDNLKNMPVNGKKAVQDNRSTASAESKSLNDNKTEEKTSDEGKNNVYSNEAADKKSSKRFGQFRKKKDAVSEEKDKEGEIRLHPEIRVSKNSVNPANTKKQGVYVKGKAVNVFDAEDDGNADAMVSNNTDTNRVTSGAAGEDKTLREQIEDLRQDDVIIHKYFGKGVVYDNSDVNLIEVRFGNEQRFLNKNSIASKKLIKICEEERRWRR